MKVLCKCDVCCWDKHFQMGLPSLSWSVSGSLLLVPLSIYASALQSLSSVTWYSQELKHPLQHGVILEIGWGYFWFGICGREETLPSEIGLERVSSQNLRLSVLITVSISVSFCPQPCRQCEEMPEHRARWRDLSPNRLLAHGGKPKASKETAIPQCFCDFQWDSGDASFLKSLFINLEGNKVTEHAQGYPEYSQCPTDLARGQSKLWGADPSMEQGLGWNQNDISWRDSFRSQTQSRNIRPQPPWWLL